MNDNSRSDLTAADIAEFEAALNELSGTARHIFFRLIELHPLEKALEIIAGMEDGEDVPDYHFAGHDPYAKCVPSSQPHGQNVQIDKGGCLCVKNPSACWVPELTIHRQIGGTVYTVTGSYSGSEMLDKKLLRVMARNAENMEDSE